MDEPSRTADPCDPPQAELQLGYARLDLERGERTLLPEVVFGETKSLEQLAGIAAALRERGLPVLITRVDSSKGEQLCSQLPWLHFDPEARALHSALPEQAAGPAEVGLLAAGTSDLPVLAEAELTLRWAGLSTQRYVDVGVAGLHRLLRVLPELTQHRVLLAFAGMEGALPAVLTGLVSQPVIAVPVSVGYGAALSGLTAMLGMLSSCASGLTVVNVDNGFGAAVAAVRILRSGRAAVPEESHGK